MAAVVVLLPFAVSCSKDEDGDTVPGLAVRTNPAQATATVQDIEVLSAGGSWTSALRLKEPRPDGLPWT